MMWSEQDNALVAQLEFDSFEKVMDFMQQAARDNSAQSSP